MNPLYNKNNLKNRRRSLRHQATYSEKILWQDLRNRKMRGVKFYRQFSIGNFIYDFYCPEIQLAIELDGATHQELRVIENDRRKNLLLSENDIYLLRFTDEELFENYVTVLKRIEMAVERMRTPPTPS